MASKIGLEHIGDIVKGLPSEERQTLGRRLRSRVRRAFHHGIAHSVLSVLLLGGALGGVRAWLQIRDEYSTRLLKQVDELLRTTHEPRLDGRTGLTSAVLTTINRTNGQKIDGGPTSDLSRWDCSPENDDCVAGRAVRDNFTLFAQLANAPSTPAGQALGDTNELLDKMKFAPWTSDQERQTTAELARRRIIDVSAALAQDRATHGASRYRRSRAKVTSEVVSECASALGGAGRADSFGPLGCDMERVGRYTHLIIPALAYPSPAAPRSDLSPRLQRAERISNLLEPAIASAIPRGQRTSPSDEMSLVQAYFISVDNLLRIWTRGGVSDDIYNPVKLWADVNYFRVFLSEAPPSAYTTPAYLDWGGQGFVRSECDPVLLEAPGLRSLATKSPDPVEPEFIGIVCADFKLPVHEVARTISKSPFFECYEVEFPKFEPTLSEEVRIRSGRNGEIQSALPNGASLSRVKAALLEGAAGQSLSTNAVSQIEVPSDDGTTIWRGYLLPMGIEGRRLSSGILIIPKAPGPPLIGTIALVSACALVLAGALMAWGIARARESNEHARRLGILGKLPIGVIEVDPEGSITFANDRAEEVVGRELPRRPGDRVSANFWSEIIEDQIIREGPNGKPEGGLRHYADTVLEDRRRDRRSTYFACLRNTGWSAWVRITATPVLGLDPLETSGRHAGVPASFGILEPVQDQPELRKVALDSLPGPDQMEAR